MKQYCRYCGLCFEADCCYCSNYERVLTLSNITHENHCKDYADIDEDVLTGKKRKERKQDKTLVNKALLQDLFGGDKQ